MLNLLKTFALLATLDALLMAAGWLLAGTWGAAIALTISLALNFSSWFYSDRLALAVYQAKPIGPRQAPKLYQMVEQLASEAKLPMPGVYIVPASAPNAFATGRDPSHAAVAVTQGLLELLSDDELAGVIAHELSHIAHRDTLIMAIAASMAGAISWLVYLPAYSRQEGANALATILAVIVAPFVALILQMGISRTREFEADAGAARLTHNPEALARALQRLEHRNHAEEVAAPPAFRALLIFNRPNSSWLREWLSTHPSTSRRVARLMALDM